MHGCINLKIYQYVKKKRTLMFFLELWKFLIEDFISKLASVDLLITKSKKNFFKGVGLAINRMKKI